MRGRWLRNTGGRLTEVEDWRPLLEFTQGNPLTITVLVGQALREGLKTKEQIKAFVSKLRAGEASFDDELSEGRSKSLDASLSYGFGQTFSEEERKKLALLHFFQGFVNVGVLIIMGDPKAEWCLPEVRGMTQEDGIALLDRAAEIGLLTSLGGGYYTVHPALPWFFSNLFEQYYSSRKQDVNAARAFVEAMGELGSYYFGQYESGNRDVIAALAYEEENLLHARQLARMHGWWGRVIDTMQGLGRLYEHTGRRGEWARLVNEIVPDFVDPATDGAIQGREEEWSLVGEYRVVVAKEAQQWNEAEQLQHLITDWHRKEAVDAITVPPEKLDNVQHNKIQNLSTSLHELAEILRELGLSECVALYEESLKLDERIGDKSGASHCAYNLGNAYLLIPAIHDLAKAENWYLHSLKLTDERDLLWQSKCLQTLGAVGLKRFEDAQAAGKPEEELLSHLNKALQFYQQALEMIPPDAVDDLAKAHSMLGVIYNDAYDLDRALQHYREAIRYYEMEGDIYGAAITRYNVALDLAQAGRFEDALDYANAALRNYETYGDRAAKKIQETRELIADIEQAIKTKGDNP